MRGVTEQPALGAGRRWWALTILVLAVLTAGDEDLAGQGLTAAGVRPDTLALHGVVVDSATGEPVRGALVRLVELERQDLSHDDGGFHLTRIPAGSYTLMVEHLGYGLREQTVLVPTPAPLRIHLTQSAIDLPGLLVTGTLGARSRSEAHSLSQVLRGRELQRELDATLAGTIEGRAGLASASMGPAPARPVIRGLSGNRILVLEDGERVGDVSSTSADHAVSVEAGSAERIEVVRGPAALFYGSNALGGVINVIRDEIPSALPDRPTGTLMVQGQSVNRGGLAMGSYRQAVGPVGIRVEGSGRSAADTRTAAGVLENTELRTFSGAAGAAWLAGFGHAGMSGRLYRSEYGIPPDPVLGHPEGVDVELERDALRGEVVVEDAAGLGNLSATGGYTRYEHREIEAGGALGTVFAQETAALELVLRHEALGPFSGGGFGVRGEWQDFFADNGRSRVLSVETSAAVFGLQELDLEPVTFQVGARYDVHRVAPGGADEVRGVDARTRVFHNLSGSASALWKLAPGWRLGTSVSRAFRSPSPDELFSQGPHLAAYSYEIGNPDLGPETGIGADVFLRVDRPGINAEAGVFWNEINDYSYPVSTGEERGNLFVYRFLNTNARFTGAELSGQWVVTRSLVLDGDVSYVRASNLELDEPLPLIPPLNGSLALRWDRQSYFLEAGWEAAATQDRVPARPALPPTSPPYCSDATPGESCRPVPGDFVATAGYSTLSAGAGYRWFPGHQAHSVTLRVENLTDELYRSHLSRIKELSPEPGLGVTLSYRVSF
jgi:iron complex outermembrane receptor protein